MSAVTFYEESPRSAAMKYAVIVARYRGKWILCRHKERTTWEIPGGHLEANETPDQAAIRELWEETGTVKAKITRICCYGVQDYGMLYFAEVKELTEATVITPVENATRIKAFLWDDMTPITGAADVVLTPAEPTV